MLLVYFLTYRAPSQILLIDALLRLLECDANIDFRSTSLIGGTNLPFSCRLMINFLIASALSGVANEIVASRDLASLDRRCFIA